jgi:hypothetical protein
MIPKQPALRPSDIIVACQLAIAPKAQFSALAEFTGISVGECHNAVRRLRISRLLLTDERRPPVDVLLQFLVHGVPFAFPAVIGPEIVGVPTAYSAAPFDGIVASADALVWAHADGAARGQALTPLFPGAPNLLGRNQALYEILAVVDALRIGSARVRAIAAGLLGERIQAPPL